MQETRAWFLRGFAGEYIPIHYRASVSPQNDVGTFVFMLIKQGGTSGRVSSNMRQFPSTDGSNTVCNPDFFVYGSQPQPIPNKVPVGSPIVQVTIEVRTMSMLVTGTVKVVVARSITSLSMSDPAAEWVFDAAGWAAAAVEATGLSIEQGRLPRARMSLKQDFQDLRDFRKKPPTPVPHEKLTHEQLGSRTVLRLAVVSTGLGMQHGATGEFTFVGEYAPIAIYTKGLAVSMYMIKRDGSTPRDTAMREFGKPDQRMVCHPDFFDFFDFVGGGPGGPGGEPRMKRGLLKARTPVVTLLRDLTPGASSVLRFSRFKSDTEPPVQVAQRTVRATERSVTPPIEWMQFTVTWIR